MLWYVVPLGVAAALSLFPILAVVLLLLSPNPIPSGVGYLAGWSVGVLVLVTVFSLGARLIPPSTTERMPPWAHVAELALGLLLLAAGIWRTVADRQRTTPSDPPSWTKAIDRIGPRQAFAFGLAMSVRPKNLAIALAAGLAIGSASLSIVGSSLTVLIFTAVAVSTVAALVLSYVFGSHSVRPRLERFSDWLVANSSLVLNLSVVVVGALLVVLGTVNLL